MKRTTSVGVLKAEVARLEGLLDAHGIAWRAVAGAREGGMSRGAHEKVAIFRGFSMYGATSTRFVGNVPRAAARAMRQRVAVRDPPHPAGGVFGLRSS